MILSRRRFLTISAAACMASNANAAPVHRISFQALGADCQITLPGSSGAAHHAVGRIRTEIEAIEQAFSLYRKNSQLSRLNRDGFLSEPSQTFLSGFQFAQALHAETGGAFDPTVQALWQAHATRTDPGPVGMSNLVHDKTGIRFTKPNMSATFNGIAQGIATDHAVAVLESLGYRNVLANLGEFRALGQNPNGNPWRIGVQNPASGTIATILSPTPTASAIATSEPRGTLIAGSPHAFDPFSRSGPRWASVTIQANAAALADGLSTAIAASPVAEAVTLLQNSIVTKAILIDTKGNLTRWQA